MKHELPSLHHEETLFNQFGRLFSPHTIKKNAVLPFKNHAQFGILLDILNRKNKHHVCLRNTYSPLMQQAFLAALTLHLQDEFAPRPFRDTSIIYFDVDKAKHIAPPLIEQDFLQLQNKFIASDKRILIALSDNQAFLDHQSDNYFFLKLRKLVEMDTYRFLVFIADETTSLPNHFQTITLGDPSDLDLLTILKQERLQLETYHQVSIPEDLLPTAYLLSERFLSTKDTLAETLMLLDSSAARAKQIESENAHSFKPSVTLKTLQSVLSTWTHIPDSHIQLQQFNLKEFKEGMQQRIFGQETALHLLSQHLLQSQTKLRERLGPLAAFHFAGAKHTGKRTTSIALADQLFKQINVIYSADAITQFDTSLFTLKFKRQTDKKIFNLKTILRECPHAILLLEFTDNIALQLQEELYDILNTNIFYDEAGCSHHFQQAILIVSSTLGSKTLESLTLNLPENEAEQEMDLMKLISANDKKSTKTHATNFLSNDVLEDLQSEVQAALSQSLHDALPLIPFVPLSELAIEKIIRLKLKLLSKLLDARYGIEFDYAAEAVHYLVNEVILQQRLFEKTLDIEKVLKHLYVIIEQAILSQVDNKNRPNQLFLQLNERGQLLRCDWISLSVRQHTQ